MRLAVLLRTKTLICAAASPGPLSRLTALWKWKPRMQMALCSDLDPITIKPASRGEGLSNKTVLLEMGNHVEDVAVGVKHANPLVQLR